MTNTWTATIAFVVTTTVFIPQSQAQDSSVSFLTGYFATYADIPIYSTQPEACNDGTLTQIVNDFSLHYASTGVRCAAVSVDRHRRHWVADIIPFCSCIDSVQMASEMKCHAMFDISGAIEKLSVAQLHAWCSAAPYAYSTETGGYNFVMDGEPNTVDLSVGVDGVGVSVSVEVNLPSIAEGAVLIAKGHTGSCFDAKDVFLVNNNETEFVFNLTCSGGACRGASTISTETEASILNLGSVVIYDSLTSTAHSLAVQPRFLCATMAYSDEAQARMSTDDDDDDVDDGDGDDVGDHVSDDKECNPNHHGGKGKHKKSKSAHCRHHNGKAKSVGSLLSQTTTSTNYQNSGMTGVVVGVCSIAAVIGFVMRKIRRTPRETTTSLFSSSTKRLNRLEAEGGVQSVAAIEHPEKLPLLEHDDE